MNLLFINWKVSFRSYKKMDLFFQYIYYNNISMCKFRIILSCETLLTHNKYLVTAGLSEQVTPVFYSIFICVVFVIFREVS